MTLYGTFLWALYEFIETIVMLYCNTVESTVKLQVTTYDLPIH